MADVTRLLQAAIQAVEAGAPDLAADFAERAIRELRLGAPRAADAPELPWSTQPRDEGFVEFVRRAEGFLSRFAEAPGGEVAEEQARALAREFFAEQPRVVGPSFYRRGALETERTAEGTRPGPHGAETDAQPQQVHPCEEPPNEHPTSRVTRVTSRCDAAAYVGGVIEGDPQRGYYT